jgi:predicted mannosyl-3-phosphoglycerate phosphatase (HAD superfamily)
MHRAGSGRVLVFCDADAAMAQATREACADAAGILQRVRAGGAIVVLCSGKTRAEVEQMQQDLRIADPFVVEHGSAAFLPRSAFPFDAPDTRDVADYSASEPGPAADEVVRVLHHTAAVQQIDILGFGDLSIEEVAWELGGTLLQARLAKLLDYGERFRIVNATESARRRLFRGLQAAGLRCIEGSRFHYAGAGPGLPAVVARMRSAFSDRATSVVVLEPHNDIVEWAEAIASEVQAWRAHYDERLQRF